jgi:membrane protein YqaA with SNARE-associated domain
MNDAMAAVGEYGVLAVVALGVLSAFIPILNAEVILAAAVPLIDSPWWVLTLAIASAQTVGKVAIYYGSREGADWLREWRRRRGRVPKPMVPGSWRARTAAWSKRVLDLAESPVGAWAVVLISAFGGIPPLAVVSVLAGARRMPVLIFTTACLIGRIGRFALIAYPVAQLTQ